MAFVINPGSWLQFMGLVSIVLQEWGLFSVEGLIYILERSDPK